MGSEPSKIFDDLNSTFPDISPSCSAYISCVQMMRGGTFELQKRTSSERPRETRSLENVDRVKDLVDGNPRLRTEEVDSDISLPRTAVFRFWDRIFRCDFC